MSINEPKTCFFTGHRIISAANRSRLTELLFLEIENKIRENVTVFIAGGALGFDTMAAEAVIRMRSIYENIQLHLYLPCTDQDLRWSERDREIYAAIKQAADKVCYISRREYEKGCMKKRNAAMVCASSCGIAYVVNRYSGSAQTLEMAKTRGTSVINLAEFF